MIPLLVGLIALLPSGAALGEPLPIECDDGASVVLVYFDISPESERKFEFGECGESSIGDWNRVGFEAETSAATVSALGLVRSEDGFTLEVSSEIELDVEDFAAVSVFAEGEARFRSPDADEDIDAEVIVEIARTGELDVDELSLAVLGPGVDLFENLEDVEDGEVRFEVELEPDEEYRAILVAETAELFDTVSGSQTLRVRVETVPVPEPAGALLLGVGALTLGGARRFYNRPRLRDRGRAAGARRGGLA